MLPLDWLIVGGGIHGTHLAIRMLAAGKVSADRLRLLDPHPGPLHCWDHCTRSVGMKFLRSPAVHQLAASPFALYDFLRDRPRPDEPVFASPYNRPSLDLFRAHCEHLIREHAIRDLWIQGRAIGLRERGCQWVVETERGALHARRLIVAVGLGEQPHWPRWASALREMGGPVAHVFSPEFELPRSTGPIVVVGGGISAVQIALACSEEAPGRVTLIARHAPRIAQFDSDPGWLGPLYLKGFARESDLGRRRLAIASARHRGSMPPDVHEALEQAVATGALRTVHDTVATAQPAGDECLLHLEHGHDALRAAHVILATGFDARRPGAPWIDAAITALGLPCAECGYPRVDAALRWHPRLHVSGPLAELELGPAARNIAGARMAAERIVRAA